MFIFEIFIDQLSNFDKLNLKIYRNRWFFRQYGADGYLSMEQDVRAGNHPSYPLQRWITAMGAILCGFIKPPGTRPMNFARHALWLFGILVILTDPLLAAEYIGKVVGISDGDTLTLLVPDGDSDNCPVTCRWFYAPYAITF